MNKWKRDDFLKELETRLWEECGTIYKLGGIGRYDGPNGKRTYDCVGVLKSVLWNYSDRNPSGYAKEYPDVNVGGMKARCTKIMPFDPDKMEPGMLVFIGTEHIGMVGDPKYFKENIDPINIIYEATPAFLNCFQRTSVAERASRPWTEMGYADFIDYAESEKPSEDPGKDEEETVHVDLKDEMGTIKTSLETITKALESMIDKMG